MLPGNSFPPTETVCSTMLAICLACSAAQAAADPAAIVTGLQAPAWRTHAGVRDALVAGQTLDAGDRLSTGPDARVVLHLGEGSTVKLGAGAEFEIAKLQPPPAPEGVFEAALDVLKGAFRFTTAAAAKVQRRAVTAHVGTATIGIRGTDVWGKTEPGRDFVVLIEGKIDIERAGEHVAMADPKTLFMAPTGAAAQPVAPVDSGDLARWAAETEPAPGAGVQESAGSWRVNLLSTRDGAGAARWAARLRDAGYAALKGSKEIKNVEWHRVYVEGFASRADAEAFASRAAHEFELPTAWIGTR